METFIRFDWAMNHLLRNQANFDILEGFLTTLLEREVHITELLEGESPPESARDKQDRIDVVAKDARGELMLIEIQKRREMDFFQRMLYGVSKTIADHIERGNDYDRVVKVISINLMYFTFGQGRDYLYHERADFQSHNGGPSLKLSRGQQIRYGANTIGDIYPEYYVLRINEFDRVAQSPLDEWMEYLKTGRVSPTATAPGLAQVREKLREANMSPDEQRAYWRGLENEAIERSYAATDKFEGELKVKIMTIRRMLALGIPRDLIAKSVDTPEEELDMWAEDTELDELPEFDLRDFNPRK